jgi:tetratricopeptide (TPR) repeat protein
MPRFCHINRSISTLAFAAVFSSVLVAGAQEHSVQQLLERGALEEAVKRAASEGGNPEVLYLAAQALIKMDNNAEAEERYNRLRQEGDDSWKAVGESGAKLLAGDLSGAMEAANQAISANEGNPYAHFQVGLVAVKQANYERALQGFTRAVELKHDLAYAHLYAGQAAQRLKQTPRMAQHFTAFLKLAPEAPERSAVQAILRSLR